MHNEIDKSLVIKSITEIGKRFLADYKQNEIPVTKEDFFRQLEAIETTCIDYLKPIINAEYPDIPWVEDDEFDYEGQLQPADFDQYWLCDTMDGAIQYIQHLPGWTINLVLIRYGKPYFSVIYDPLSDEVFSAQQGTGAFLNGAKISVKPKEDQEIMLAVFEYGHQAKKKDGYQDQIAKNVARLIETFGIVRNYGPHALQLAYVGIGRIDVFLQGDLDTHNWLAGMLIAEEAGTSILSTDGHPWTWGTKSLLVTKKGISDLFLKSLS